MKYVTLLALCVVPFLALSAGKTPHAPLPPALMNAKTIFIDNQSGDADLLDKCYDELTKWGRFKIVADPKDADVAFRIQKSSRNSGYSERTDPWGNTHADADTQHYTTISVVDKDGNVLWSDTRPWRMFSSATRNVVKELRQRMESQGR